MASKFQDMLDIELFQEFFNENDIKKPTDIQSKSIPALMDGENISVLAKTGSGKTYSYLLPVFQMLKASESKIELPKGSPRAVVIVPIKELAIQVGDVAKGISHHIKQRVRVALGGTKGKKVSSLKTQTFDILVGGPGRIKSMLSKGEISFDALEFFIVDEADQLMDMGFSKDMMEIKKHIDGETQVGLFSATMGPDFEELRAQVFTGFDFKMISTQGTTNLVQTIETFNISLAYTEKKKMIELFLNQEAKGSGIIFVNQKENAQELYTHLKSVFPKKKIYPLHGQMSSNERQDSFKKFKNTGGLLIATDMAARGIDIKKLTWVLNYDLPFESVYYIHRSGRVGRMGRPGKVYNFVTGKDQKLIKSINDAIKAQSTLKIDPIFIKKPKSKSSGKGAAKPGQNRAHAKTKRAPRYKRK